MTVRPPIYCCLPPVCPTWAPPEASLCLGCAACGSLRWDPGLYIEPLRTLRVQTFHSTSERLLPSMRNSALALITSHDQDHSVVSGWNWQAGFSLTLSKWARWEVLPAKTCVSTAVALRSFKENIKKKKKVGSSSLVTNSRTEDFMFYGDTARFRSGQVFWGTFRRTVFCLPATRLMINNQIGNLFYFLFFQIVVAILALYARGALLASPLLSLGSGFYVFRGNASTLSQGHIFWTHRPQVQLLVLWRCTLD